MNWHYKLAVGAMVVAAGVAGMSCTSDPKSSAEPATPEAPATAAADPRSGEAGGMLQESYTASASVTAIEPETRKITLVDSDGAETTFTAGPEIRNFDQIRVGDKVQAEVTERLDVFVRSDGAEPSASHTAAVSTAPKGDKPGAMVAEVYEVVAKVESIDSVARTATLKFVDGQTRIVAVRPDVDLTRYQAGDNVVIRVTAWLAVLVRE